MDDEAREGRRYDTRLAYGGSFGGVLVVLRAIRTALVFAFFACIAFRPLAGAFPLAFLSLGAVSVVLAIGQLAQKRRDPAGTAGYAEVGVVDGRLALFFTSPDGRRDRSILLKRIRSALIVPNVAGGKCPLVITGQLGLQMTLDFDDLDGARALLHEMHLSPREESATFYFSFGLHITVGADGVLLRWPLLGRERFVPYARILSVTPSFGRIQLHLMGHQAYEILTTTSRAAREQDHHHALLERIAHAFLSYRTEHASEPTALLDRSGRTALGWIKDLALLLRPGGGGGYRTAALPEDTLWSVALDPAAKEETRIGAALALRSALDDAGRKKLRVAAEASASPRVRVALDAAADELTDEQLGEALDEAAPTRRQRA